MHEGKGEEVLDTNLIGASSGKGQGKHEGIAVQNLSDVHR